MYKQLRQARRAQGISQQEMADLLGLRSRNAYSLKERGERGIEIGEALAIAGYLKKPVEALFLTEEGEQNGYSEAQRYGRQANDAIHTA